MTFEELTGMLEAKEFDFNTIEESASLNGGTGAGLSVDKTTKFVEKYSKEAITAVPTESPYRHVGEKLD